jgi:D-beta-D-heptose 7-phosphate kinase/D-beta-D-heptose 1-phosphate adenosyltransferase
MKNSRFLVLGETCKDIYVYCAAKRLAPDFPVPVLEISTITENPGMAMNLRRNILQVRNQCDIVTNSNWETITKTRYVHEETNYMFIRIDSPHIIEPFNLNDLDFSYDYIIISDYDKGFLSQSDIKFISTNHQNVFLDTKKVLGPWADNCRFIKVNDYEYRRSQGNISKHLDARIIRTLGKEGCLYQGKQFKTREVDVRDSSGAGDAFFAAFVVEFNNSGNVEQSLEFANSCASKVVSERGVTLICPEL